MLAVQTIDKGIYFTILKWLKKKQFTISLHHSNYMGGKSKQFNIRGLQGQNNKTWKWRKGTSRLKPKIQCLCYLPWQGISACTSSDWNQDPAKVIRRSETYWMFKLFLSNGTRHFTLQIDIIFETGTVQSTYKSDKILFDCTKPKTG